eukprot:1814114-Rhodomonas_salina.1
MNSMPAMLLRVWNAVVRRAAKGLRELLEGASKQSQHLQVPAPTYTPTRAYLDLGIPEPT